MNITVPDQLILIVFILNLLLIFLDATVGYHLAPRLLRIAGAGDTEIREIALQKVRRMLTGLVALYMFFNCLGYFGGNSTLLMIVAGMIVIDLVVQLYLSRRFGHDGEQP